MKAIQVKRTLQSTVNYVAQPRENYVMHPNTDTANLPLKARCVAS